MARWVLALALIAGLGQRLPANAEALRLVRPLTGTVSPNLPTELAVYADRVTYERTDRVAQVLVILPDREGRLELRDGEGPIEHRELSNLASARLEVIVALDDLADGRYELVVRSASGSAARSFDLRPAADGGGVLPPGGIDIRVDPQHELAGAVWPIATAVPFAAGTLADADDLALYEDGRPISAEIKPLSYWQPLVPGIESPAIQSPVIEPSTTQSPIIEFPVIEPPVVESPVVESPVIESSVQWLRLAFQARYDGGTPRTYRLRRRQAAPPPATATLAVTGEGDRLRVDTGRVRFDVSHRRFAGIEELWLDSNGDGRFEPGERLIVSGGGPYVVDERGRRFEASGERPVEVAVEEAGPLRAVIAVSGWYADPTRPPAERRFCRYRTRITAWAGMPSIHFQHHTILTYDTNQRRLRDAGFGFHTAPVDGWRVGIDGALFELPAPAEGSSDYLHQYRWDAARLLSAGKETRGKRADGAFVVDLEPSDNERQSASLALLVRDFWQKYPQEVEALPDGLVFHAWPAHGLLHFDEDELYDRDHIYKLRFFHQGDELDLRFPPRAEAVLRDKDGADPGNWLLRDPENAIDAAREANGQGLAIGSDFILMPAAESGGNWISNAHLFQRDPHARADPAWTARSLVEGHLAPRDERFPDLESDLDTFHRDYLQAAVDGGTEYGRFIYADTHNHWDPAKRRALLHRVWQASHYRHVSTPWLLYLRGNSADLLTWARAQTDHLRDIGTVNWSDPENPLPWHVAGSFYHAKGFVPWGAAHPERSTVGYAGFDHHWIDPGALLLRYILEDDRRSWDVYRLWVETLRTRGRFTGNSRGSTATLGEILGYYRFTRDPAALEWIGRLTEDLLSIPLEELSNAPSHPLWHGQWYSRLYELTRDPRIIDRLAAYVAAYPDQPAAQAFVGRHRPGTSRLLDFAYTIYDRVRTIYRRDGDPVSGYREGFSAVRQRFYQEIPYWLAGLAEAGVERLAPGDRSGIYPSASAHSLSYLPAETPSVELLALDQDDRAFNLRLESIPGRDVHVAAVRVVSPTGRQLVEEIFDREPRRKLRYRGDDAIRYSLPSDGETGLYRVDIRSHRVIFAAPYTDLPAEALLLHPRRPYRTTGRVRLHFEPTLDQPFGMTFRALMRADKTAPVWVSIADADGHSLLDTTLLYGAERDAVEVDIDPSDATPPYLLHVAGLYGADIELDGAGRWLAAPRAAALERILPLLDE